MTDIWSSPIPVPVAYSTTVQDREAWLMRGVEMFRPKFAELGCPIDKVRVAVGFGPTGARQENKMILGVTLSAVCTTDNVNEVWVSPEDADTESMLITLLHELIHVVDDNVSGHSGRFQKLALALGFIAPMESTPAGSELKLAIKEIAAELGEYPGGKVDLAGIVDRLPEGAKPPKIASGPKKQTTRMLAARCTEGECPAIGYTIRMTRKWMDEFGTPVCPGYGMDGVESHTLTEG